MFFPPVFSLRRAPGRAARPAAPFAIAAAVMSAAGPVAAQVFDWVPESRTGGKLLLTGGVSSVEGSGGGGIATWAVTTGYGAEDGVGANLHATYINLPDYEFRSVGAAVGLWDRVEVSIARQEFDTGATGALLGLGKGFTFTQDIVGVKVKVLGDAVYASDSWMPQIAVGAQFKSNDQGAIIAAVGGQDDEGTDVYVAATKLFLGQSLLVSGAVRWTNANQTGLLGYGGDRNDDLEPQFEGSVGYLLSSNLVVGAEYRTKPDNLGFASEDDWVDVYAAYALNKHLSVTAAWADLGSIATFEDQRGLYLSLQVGF
ncbi:hypothetical protein KOAAANKH_00440 [Brevundimonas sp. NIBR10]|uniref:DUF3034 family protein n=1 Tax=Brevundimonas sp. NIBR10 TaxID=3015997 RepID=UPI0022F194BD|nr:DUF3034 family protein [Brevundimonas sp. NIBR10]WGM45577.1 hypothetical protein KOAAANKH_00440 [Brevundimonas sp. NIBR10]